MEPDQFQALWAMLSRAHPSSNRLAGEDTAAEYFQHLNDLNYEDVMAGAVRCVDDLDFPPTIAQLRTAAALERDSRVVRRSILPAIAAALPPVAMPWYVRLQFARQKDGKQAGYPLLEDQDVVRAECGERGIEIDVWPVPPRWYGKNLPIPADGEADHAADCSGLVISEFEMRSGDARATYAPCQSCRAGQRAVFDAGLLHGSWVRDERAVCVYVRAELDAGNVPSVPSAEEQSIVALWRRVIKDRGREAVEV